MPEILKEILPEKINYYIEKNLDDFYIKSSQHPNFSSSKIRNIEWILAKKADWPNSIFRTNFNSLNIENEIKKIRNLIRKGKAPNSWTVGPLTTPKDLGTNLEKYGFSNVYYQSGMAIELKDLERNQLNEENLLIKKVEDESSLIQWTNIISKVFNLRADIEHLRFMHLKKEALFYLGFFENEPVSALLLYFSSGVAGLHAVSTLFEYRNRGFGFAISRTALIDAFNMGYYVGVLQASSLGEKVYRKLGFQKYCEIISYALLDGIK